MGVGRVYPMGDSRTCWFAAGSDPAEVMQIVAQVRGTIAGMQPLWRPGGAGPRVQEMRPPIIHRREGKGCGYEGVCCLTWCWEV